MNGDMGRRMSDGEYVEQTIKRLIEELKQKNCLSQDFQFLTKAEREVLLEQQINQFLSLH